MHILTQYDSFETANNEEFLTVNDIPFNSLGTIHEFDEVVNSNSFTSIIFDFGELISVVGSAIDSSNLFSGLTWIPGAYTEIVNSFININKFSKLNINEFIGLWKISQELLPSIWTDESDTSTIWTNYSDTTTIWTDET